MPKIAPTIPTIFAALAIPSSAEEEIPAAMSSSSLRATMKAPMPIPIPTRAGNPMQQQPPRSKKNDAMPSTRAMVARPLETGPPAPIPARPGSGAGP